MEEKIEKKLKGIYISVGSEVESSGVEKKICNQIKVLSEHFEVQRVIIRKSNASKIRRAMSILPFCSVLWDYDAAKNTIEETYIPDFIYIRGIALDRQYSDFLCYLREKYPKCKIVFELPTYPYDLELLHNKTMWPWYFKDHFYRGRLKRYVDRIVTFSEDDEIFGIPTIKTMNGIDVDSIELNFEKENQQNRDCINLLAVAQFQKSHGYERVIKGLYHYYNQNIKDNVLLHMVGYGGEEELYHGLVNKYCLEDKVIFHGPKIGKELDELYRFSDIGMGSFGFYKRGICISSSLKIREYLSYGLPIVSGVYEDAFPEKSAFFLRYPNDSSVVDINKIVDFYNRLRSGCDEFALKKKIREYAINNVDINITMKPIIEYIDS